MGQLEEKRPLKNLNVDERPTLKADLTKTRYERFDLTNLDHGEEFL
jgi:hypothetical protein